MFVLKLIKKWLAHTCVYFTISILIYLLIQAITIVGENFKGLEVDRTLLILVFSLLLALANTVLTLDKLSTALKIAIHFVIVMFAFYACLLLPVSMPASRIFVGLVLAAIVYAIIMGLVALFRSRYKRISESHDNYENKFSKKTK